MSETEHTHDHAHDHHDHDHHDHDHDHDSKPILSIHFNILTFNYRDARS